MRCVIVDYGMGNLRSIQHKLGKIDIAAVIGSTPDEIEAADFLILPGVGYFAKGMENLAARGLIETLNRKVLNENCPILGICLGMQLFSRRSEEGNADGLGWIDAETKCFLLHGKSGLRIPHMGWNTVVPREESALFDGIEPEQRFYFVHSYHVCCNNEADVLATTEYGDIFTSAVHRNNIFGAQFHPEKSHRRGMRIIENFVRYCQVKKKK